MRFAPLVLVTLLPASGFAADRHPLYDAFLEFCAATGANAAAVKAAVEKNGGQSDREPGTTTYPWPMGARSWTVTVEGHTMSVIAGVGAPPAHGDDPAWLTSSCTVNSDTPDKASLAAIGAWAGVPANTTTSNRVATIYECQQRGGRHVLLPRDLAGWRTAQSEDVWDLTLQHGNRFSGAFLMHASSPRH